MKILIEVTLERTNTGEPFSEEEEREIEHALDDLLDEGEIQNQINGWLEILVDDDGPDAVIAQISARRA